MATLQLAPDNSAYIQITITNPITAVSVDDATVTAVLNNLDGTNLVASFPLVYVAASAGIYRATIIPVVGLVNGTTYKLVVSATGADALIGKWSCNIKAQDLAC
jgi:hypothetical protein